MGLLVICGRGPLVVAPAAVLRRRAALIETNTRTRILGIFVLILSAAMVGAGTTGDSTLALILTLWGSLGLVVGLLVTVFPGPFRDLARAFLPSDEGGLLPGWRMVGVLNIVAGFLLIYFGALAL